MHRSALLGVVLAACSGRSHPPPAQPPRPVDPTPVPVPVPAEPPLAPEPVAPRPIQLTKEQIADAKVKAIEKHGAAHKARIERGVDQVALHWRANDGDFGAFCVAQFAADQKAQDALFDRLQAMFEQVDGHFLELGRSARWGNEVEAGPVLPVDALLAAYDAGAHVNEDMFASKVAFAVLLNFPLTKLADRIRDGASYNRRTWAEVRLAGRFARRVPGDVALAASQAEAAADEYIAGYNLWMHHVLGQGGERRFPSKKRLISHWNLRDELKANYADKDGLAKQRTIASVMDRIVTQTIPRAVIDNPTVDWDPVTNKVTAAAVGTVEDNAPQNRLAASDAREPDLRHENVRRHFEAAKKVDKYSPLAPTLIERAFTNAEVPEARVREILVEILDSPLAADVAKDAERRLGRKLEPHDLWYEFGGGDIAEAELDAVTKKRYPTAAAFAADIPRILRDLGFTADRAKYLSEHIAVDPSRGAGHAMEARRRGDKAHLRTRVAAGGMDYKGYNIAVHELGHNVEQVFSLYDIDHTLLAGVPNTAFTEALAFLFQARNLALIGRPSRGAEVDKLRVLDAFWNTREIAGSALVEMDVWRWLYANPNATAAQIREATVKIARDTWDKYYAPYLGGTKGSVALLGIYSHTIASPLYLMNYVLGHLIAFQVEEHVLGKDKATFAKEFERVSRLGQILPDLWMKAATGAPVGPKAMLDATARAIKTK